MGVWGVHSTEHRIKRSQRLTRKSAAVRPQKSETAADRRIARQINGLGRAVVVTAADRRRPPHHAAIAISTRRTIFLRMSDFRPYGATAISDAANSDSIAILNCFVP
jgi:hypothetical protein